MSLFFVISFFTTGAGLEFLSSNAFNTPSAALIHGYSFTQLLVSYPNTKNETRGLYLNNVLTENEKRRKERRGNFLTPLMNLSFFLSFFFSSSSI